jgi:predicted nucleic acid-binding protein
MIVADTNLVAYFLLRGDITKAAESVRANDPHWISPPLFRYELMNVLGFHIRGGLLDRDIAVRLYRRGMAMVTIDDFAPNPVSMFNLCLKSGCSTYDLEFVALAMHHRVALVTADQQVVRAFPDLATDLTRLRA